MFNPLLVTWFTLLPVVTGAFVHVKKKDEAFPLWPWRWVERPNWLLGWPQAPRHPHLSLGKC